MALAGIKTQISLTEATLFVIGSLERTHSSPLCRKVMDIFSSVNFFFNKLKIKKKTLYIHRVY